MNRSLKQSQGFSMIELLISVVILAVGLLGVAGIQSIGIRTASVALDHNTATQLAVDIVERMRTNPDAFYNDAYKVDSIDAESTLTNVDCTPSSACTPAQKAQRDLYQWHSRLIQLNQGTATIARSGQTATVTIEWVDVTFGGQAQPQEETIERTGEESQSFTLSARMSQS